MDQQPKEHPNVPDGTERKIEMKSRPWFFDHMDDNLLRFVESIINKELPQTCENSQHRSYQLLRKAVDTIAPDLHTLLRTSKGYELLMAVSFHELMLAVLDGKVEDEVVDVTRQLLVVRKKLIRKIALIVSKSKA